MSLWCEDCIDSGAVFERGRRLADAVFNGRSLCPDHLALAQIKAYHERHVIVPVADRSGMVCGYDRIPITPRRAVHATAWRHDPDEVRTRAWVEEQAIAMAGPAALRR